MDGQADQARQRGEGHKQVSIGSKGLALRGAFFVLLIARSIGSIGSIGSESLIVHPMAASDQWDQWGQCR